MLRPLLCATMIIAAVFASHLNNATPNRSAAAALKGGAAAARLDLPRALQRAFQPAHHRPQTRRLVPCHPTRRRARLVHRHCKTAPPPVV